MTKQARNFIITLVSILLLGGGGVLAENHTSGIFKIKVAEWDEWRQELFMAGLAQEYCEILFYDAGNMVALGEILSANRRWFITLIDLYPVPCRICGEQLESEYCDYALDCKDVQYAPDDCSP